MELRALPACVAYGSAGKGAVLQPLFMAAGPDQDAENALHCRVRVRGSLEV